MFGFFDLEPVLGSTLCCVAVLLLCRHVRSADPVFVLSFALQMLQHIALHLPSDFSWAAVFSDPLFTRDAFPQQGKCEEHGRISVTKGEIKGKLKTMNKSCT